jgi:hypothetical protein
MVRNSTEFAGAQRRFGTVCDAARRRRRAFFPEIRASARCGGVVVRFSHGFRRQSMRKP